MAAKLCVDMTDGTPAPLIICFGDSLTVGYQSPTPQYPFIRETPYGQFLQELVGRRASIKVSGVCGEVTGEMVLRFRRDVITFHPAFVIILGGTNDLGWNAQPPVILQNLLKLYELARYSEVTPIAVTVPSFLPPTGDQGHGKKWVEEMIRSREQLNGLIREYCLFQSVALVDLFHATADPETLFLVDRFSNDGLHLTTEGYECLAKLLYDDVFNEVLNNNI